MRRYQRVKGNDWLAAPRQGDGNWGEAVRGELIEGCHPNGLYERPDQPVELA